MITPCGYWRRTTGKFGPFRLAPAGLPLRQDVVDGILAGSDHLARPPTSAMQSYKTGSQRSLAASGVL
jgi:hypothetical protein